jgi:hypothetical protein
MVTTAQYAVRAVRFTIQSLATPLKV